MIKFDSLTSPNIKHDVFNLLTEVYLLDYFKGDVPPYSWRKGQVYSFTWPRILALIKKLCKIHRITPENIAWYFVHFKHGADFKNIKLFVSDMKCLSDHSMPIREIHDLYKNKYADITGSINCIPYIYQTDKSQRKTQLLDLLRELEG